MTSAQLDLQPLDDLPSEKEDTPFALKEQVAERLAAHRARRPRPADSVTPAASPTSFKSRSAGIAAAVAERYAQSQSYRSFLAAEAERAIREAEAAAEVAAISARAVVEAQNQLLFELDQLETETARTETPAPAQPEPTPSVESTHQALHHGLTIRLYEEVARSSTASVAATRTQTHTQTRTQTQPDLDEAESYALDDEIAYRHSSIIEEPHSPLTEIPANLIEFPRQLVAPRKARPRLAEGPLREDADLDPNAAQLRIFEVEAAQISSAPTIETAAPEWSSIMLSALPAAAPVETPEAPFQPALSPQTASLSLRVMAGIVDGCIVLAALLAGIATAAFTVSKFTAAGLSGNISQRMTPQVAAIAAVGTFAIFTLLYQILFFTFSESTPGMRYARIGLCTFSDDNPTRSAMRRRIFAAILSACPLGIGFIWACLDDDGLGWHDRISRMYQRSY